MLEQAQRYEDATVLRVIAEGWNVLAEAQGALAHTCIVMLTVKSAKLNFLFECQKNLAQSLQQKFEESWISIQNFPLHEAKAAIRDLRMRLKGYLLSIHTEIISDQKGYINSIGKKTKGPKGASSSSTSSSSSSSGPTFDRSRQNNNSSEGEMDYYRATIAHQDLTPFLQQYIIKYQQQSNSSNGSGSGVTDDFFDFTTDSSISSIIIHTIGNSIFGDAFGSSWKVYSTSSSSSFSPHPSSSNRGSSTSDKDNNKAYNGDSDKYHSAGVSFMPLSLSPSLSNHPQERSFGQVESEGGAQQRQQQQQQYHQQYHHHQEDEVDGEREREHANNEDSFVLSREDSSSKRVRK